MSTASSLIRSEYTDDTAVAVSRSISQNHRSSCVYKSNRRRLSRKAVPLAELSERERTALLLRIHGLIIPGTGACWIWKHTYRKDGALIRHEDRQYRVVRVLYEELFGHLPKRLFQVCQQDRCVNPDHYRIMPILEPLCIRWKNHTIELNGCTQFYGKSWGEFGYQAFYHNGKWFAAHVFAFWLANGYWPPKDLQVNHTCDNPRCVKPAHLELGTQEENMQHKVAQNRQGIIAKLGDNHGNSKLTRRDIFEIRALRVIGTPRRDIANRFRIVSNYVDKIVRFDAWEHVGVNYLRCEYWQQQKMCLCDYCPYGDSAREPEIAGQLLQYMKVEREPEACYQWTGELDDTQQPVLFAKGLKYDAISVLIDAFFENIEAGFSFNRTCRNSHCMNPSHIAVINKPAENKKADISVSRIFNSKKLGISLREIRDIQRAAMNGEQISDLANRFHKSAPIIENLLNWPLSDKIEPNPLAGINSVYSLQRRDSERNAS